MQPQQEDGEGGGAAAAVEAGPPLFPADDVSAAKKMFYYGFALLPFLWLINYMHYRDELKNAHAPASFKRNVKMSLVGFVVFMVGWVAWLVVYYQNSGEGEWGDSLRVVSSSTTV